MILLFVLGCGPGGVPAGASAPATVPGAPPSAVAAPAQRHEVRTAAGRYTLAWQSDPAPIPFNTLFSIVTEVRDASGTLVPDARVTVDASMPQHGHGMPTHPVPDPGTCGGPSCAHPDGRYRVDGMKFHMAGEWVLRFDVDGPAGADSADVHVSL